MSEQPNLITSWQTQAIAWALEHEASLPGELADWSFRVHPGGLPGLLVATRPDGVEMKLRLVLEEMPVFGPAVIGE